MSDKYDPDRMAFEDLDLNDPEAVDAWLEHPNTGALHHDLGRAFRRAPAGDQQEVLQRAIDDDEGRLRELTELLAAADYSPDIREGLEKIRKALEENIAGAKLRMLELDVDGPDKT